MSVWDTISTGKIANKGWASWPDPSKLWVKDLEELACGDTWQAKMTYYGTHAFKLWWDAKVPSPREIVRNTFLGQYKCGFHFGTKWRSPVDIIWRNPQGRQVMMELARPFGTSLFYFSMAQTAFSALDTWQTIIYQTSKCDIDPHACMMKFGSSFLGPGFNDGGAAFSTIIQDPEGVADDTITAISPIENTPWTVNAVGYYLGNSRPSTGVEVFWRGAGQEWGNQVLGDVPAFAVVPWSLSASIPNGVGTIAPQVRATVGTGGLIPPEFDVTRFTGRSHEPYRPNYGNVGQPEDPPCWLPQEKMVRVLGLG